MDERAIQIDDPKRFWGLGEVIALAAPASLSMLSNVVMQFVDGLMVSRIPVTGPAAFGAQTTAGITHFTCMSLMFGTLTVVNTFVAQNHGAGRPSQCSRYVWQGLYLALVYAALLAPLGVLAPHLFALAGHDMQVRPLEVTYFRYLVAGTGLFLAASVADRFFYGTGRPNVVLAVMVSANLLNVAGDYVLIYGKLGLPAMGLAGAALATVISAGAAAVVLWGLLLLGPVRRSYATRAQWRPRAKELRDILRVGWPAGVQQFVDVVGWAALIVLLVGQIRTVGGVADPLASTVHLTATAVATKYMHVSFMPAVGIHIAVTSLVGQYIGRNRRDLVWRRVAAALALAMLYMGACGLAFYLWRRPLTEVFVHQGGGLAPDLAARLPDIVRIGGWVLICAAVFQVFDAVGIVFTGALRGAGDTIWPAAAQTALTVTVLIGGGLAVLRWWPAGESLGVWIVGSVYIILYAGVMAGRFASSRWKRIDLLGGAKPVPPPVETVPDTPPDVH